MLQFGSSSALCFRIHGVHGRGWGGHKGMRQVVACSRGDVGCWGTQEMYCHAFAGQILAYLPCVTCVCCVPCAVFEAVPGDDV